MRNILPSALAGLAAVFAPAAASAATDGPRAEVRTGYDSVHFDDENEDIPDSASGATFGAALGYDIALSPRFVVGVEAGAALSKAHNSVDLAQDRLCFDSDRDLDLMLRAGVQLTPGLLLYAKGGYANSRMTVRYDNYAGTGYETDVTRKSLEGYRLGTGVELGLGPKLYGKAEYRYTGYGDGISRHQALAGVGIRF